MEKKNEIALNKSTALNDNNKTNVHKYRKEKSLFIRKEIFDHAIIYTTNKLDENLLLIYLKNFYEHFKNAKVNNNNKEENLNEEIYINLDNWLAYNDLIKNQDNQLFSIFSTNICKSLWILLSITLQSVRKKNNLNQQKTIFNTPLEELCVHKYGKEVEECPKSESETADYENDKGGGDGDGNNNCNSCNDEYRARGKKDNEEEEGMSNRPYSNMGNREKGKYACEKNKKKKKSAHFNVWSSEWLNENICIELVIFFIILQFLKIDYIRKKYDKSLSEDCWPHFMDSPRAVNNCTNGSFSKLNNSMCKSNLSDFFNFCGKNYKHFLKTYLIAFLASTDITNSSTLTDVPLYFKNYNFLFLDFIVDTNDSTNVHERFLLNNEHKILYKTKDILTWLLDNLCVGDYTSEKVNSHIPCVGKNTSGSSSNGNSDSSWNSISYSTNSSNCYKGNGLRSAYSPACYENDNMPNYGIEKINNDIYEIKNLQGNTLYINNDKSIVNIINCEECNIFIMSTVEYLKINFCVDCYIISLSVEMITTLFNSNNLDVHIVTRSLKIENVVDTNIYVYTETNIIIFGDTRNIQLAPYNILNKKQKICLQKAKINFNEKKCELFAFPLKCKMFLSHSVNLGISMKTTNCPFSLGRNHNDINGVSNGVDSNIRSGSSREKHHRDDDDDDNIYCSNSGNGSCERRNSSRGERKTNEINKSFDCSSLSSSFTDYVYYLLNPAKFFLIEFSGSNFLRGGSITDNDSEGIDTMRNDNTRNDNILDDNTSNDNILDDNTSNDNILDDNTRNDNILDDNTRNDNTRNDNTSVDNNHNSKYRGDKIDGNENYKNLKCNMSDYVNKKEDDKYTCLYLPEVYKNAIENQDEHILSFLNFMSSINLTKLQKQKITKILTFKLYEYVNKSKKTFRVLSDIIARDHYNNVTVHYNDEN
ncbi:TBCC domain-containing protein [Plasmodium brasilianum]|uniref:TBCC domain-containing protein n=1 Tax=Plasmodium brasilianum TaxID=5824 RepID=A0ACB9Y2B7_PLABR|nr:TBCC domain-containing protein [Plasmodium brasilianum]